MRALFLFLTAASILFAADSQKRRVAVFDFDNPPASTTVAKNPWNPMMASSTTAAPEVGSTVADLLIAKLVRDGTCTVIERKELKRLMDEQNLSNSDRVDAATAARVGRILGVDAIILGSVTRFDHSDRTTGHPHSYAGFHVGSLNKTTHDVKADVAITARIVSPETAEILSVADGTATSEKKGVKEDNMDQYYGTANPAADIQNEAMNKAISDMAAQVEAKLAAMPMHERRIEAVVADVNSSRIVINAGAAQGVKAGDKLDLWRPGKPIRDPDSGRILRWNDEPLGEAVVTDVDSGSAAATYTSTQPVKVGDRVRAKGK